MRGWPDSELVRDAPGSPETWPAPAQAGKIPGTEQPTVLFRVDRIAPVDLSVVIPVYNVAPYLERCLSSFEGASGIERQVIIVDDGSTDASLALALAWAKRQQHVSLVVVTQANGWLSRARNVGAGFAVGEYIAFVDSDDFFQPGVHEAMVRYAGAYRCDMVQCRTVVVDHLTASTSEFYDSALWEEILGGRPALATSVHREPRLLALEPHAGAVVFRRTFMIGAGLVFSEAIRFSEDQPVYHRALLRADRVGLLNVTGYMYRVNRPGRISDQRHHDRFDVLVVADMCLKEARDAMVHPAAGGNIVRAMQRLLFWCATMTPWKDRERYLRDACARFASVPQVWFARCCLSYARSPRDLVVACAFRIGDLPLLLRMSREGRAGFRGWLAFLRTGSRVPWRMAAKTMVFYARAATGRLLRRFLARVR